MDVVPVRNVHMVTMRHVNMVAVRHVHMMAVRNMEVRHVKMVAMWNVKVRAMPVVQVRSVAVVHMPSMVPVVCVPAAAAGGADFSTSSLLDELCVLIDLVFVQGRYIHQQLALVGRGLLSFSNL
jgi:hypothetical protein